jgi:hypothetical protein
MIGYSSNGYRLWDEKCKKVVISRNVIFTENTKERISTKPGKNVLLDQDVSCDSDTSNEEDRAMNNSDSENVNRPNHDSVQTRPQRKTKLPAMLNDYVLLTYEEAVTGENKDKWIEAINEEKQSLIKNRTWNVVESENVDNTNIVSSRWIFTVKEDGRYKARLVARGFEQKKGLTFEETYSPVVSNAALRLIFGIAASKNFHMMQFDIKTAFLYGEVDEDIFMSLPEGFEEGKVVKLNKALYGLKQAPLKWNQCFSNCLIREGLEPTKCERCIFKNESNSLFLAIFVDDGILIGKDKGEMKTLLEKLCTEFEVKIDYNPKYFLGMCIERTDDQIKLKQSKYAEQVVCTYNMNDAKISETPIDNGYNVVNSNNKSEEINFPYREAVGSLLYLSNKTRPDISLAVNILSRKVEKPASNDINCVKRTLRYVKGSMNKGVSYKISKNDANVLECYCDADYAGDEESRKSTTGYVIFYAGGPISWCSRKQPIVALSSTEAEYIAAADCIKELLYLKTLLGELLVEKKVQIKLKMDNQSAIRIIKNGVFNRRSKHIDVRYHFLLEKFKEGDIILDYVCSRENIADGFTKPLEKTKFKEFSNNVVQQ